MSTKKEKRIARKQYAVLAKRHPVMVAVLHQLRTAVVESKFVMPFEPQGLEQDGTIKLKLGPLTFPNDAGQVFRIGIIEENCPQR